MSKSAATKQNDMNGVAEETAVLSPYRLIKPKQAASGDTSTKSGSIQQNKLVHSVIEKAFAKDSSNSTATCNGVSAAEKAAATDVCANQSAASPDSTSAVVTSSSMANIVFLNPSSTAKGAVAEPLKNPKLCVLNGNVLKVKSDNVSFVCAPANGGGLVKKAFSGAERAMNGAGGADNGDADRPKAGNAAPAFIQLTHPSVRGNASKFAYTMPATFVTKRTAGGGYELLRTKLLENPVAGAPTEQLVQAAMMRDKGAKGGPAASKKELGPDSPSVVAARNELVRCRKALIAAAMHPQLPIYTPPVHYAGPTYPCEECEDAFTSPQGLSNHKNRRSVLLTYACPVCRKTYEFYNRCTFLLHTRSHDDVTIKACHLTISIIPANKLNFTVLDYDRLRSDTDPTSVLEGCAPIVPSERRSSAVAETMPSPSPLVSKVTPKPGKRKASSPTVESVDDSILVCDDDSPPARKETTVSSTEEVTVIDVCESPTKDADEATPGATRTSTARKRRLLNSVVSATSVDRSTTCTTTTTTSTASTTCSATVESSGSQELGRNVVVVPVYPKGGSAPSAVSTLDEIYLTSSDEDEDAGAQNGEPQQRVTCRECKQEVANLTSHYRAANRPRKEFSCEECNFFNPSACALAAHARMHTNSPPFICPDCGFYFGTIQSFLVHVQQVCFYTHRRIRFRCPECSLLKPTWQLFYEHLRRCHIRQVFRCNVCITSSYSVQVVERHMDRLHPEAKRIIHEGHRCLLCPNMLINKQGVTEHIKKHTLDPQYLRYIYMCQYCKTYACSRMSKFEAHFDICPERASAEDKTATRKKTPARKSPKSRAQSVEVDSPPCGTLQPVEKDPLSVEKDPLFVEKDPLFVEKDLPPVEKDPLSMEDWEADKLKAEFVPKTKLCIMCRTTKLTGPSKSLFCSACVSFVNADGGVSPMEAPKGKAEGMAGRSKRKIKCKWCKQLLSRDWSVITLHYLHQHLADFDIGLPKLTKEQAALASGASRKRKTSTKQEPPAVTSPVASTTTTTGSRSSTVASTTTTRSSTPVGTPTVVSVASLAKVQKVECQYRCVKCGFSTNVRIGFHEHIVSHKMQSNTNYQCLECGECFIVKPSLEKHLIVVHKVRDIGEYYKENKMADSDEDSDDESKEKAVAENQCEVCYMECNSKQQYDRHIRTHGMAFVAMQSRAKS